MPQSSSSLTLIDYGAEKGIELAEELGTPLFHRRNTEITRLEVLVSTQVAICSRRK